MRTLSIESSGPLGSIAVMVDADPAGSWVFSSPRGRGGDMFPALEAAVARIGRADLVVVGTGPGGYNGLRMSAAAAWGIATAHGARLVGVPSLLGHNVPDYFVAGDARGGMWFVARISGGRITMPPELMEPGAARSTLLPGVPVFCAGGPLEGLADACPDAPQALILAGRTDAFGEPVPLYLKPPHITTPGRSSRA